MSKSTSKALLPLHNSKSLLIVNWGNHAYPIHSLMFLNYRGFLGNSDFILYLFFSLRIFPAKSHKIILSAWYYPVRLVSFCPQNMDETTRKSTRYISFSGSGTLGDKILHCVLGEELLKLTVELRCEGFIVCNDQRGLVQLLDDIGHREGLARSRNPQ